MVVPTHTVDILSQFLSANRPSIGDTSVRNSAQASPRAAGTAREPGLHSRSRSGVANSHVREPNRLAVVDNRMHLALSLMISLLLIDVDLEAISR